MGRKLGRAWGGFGWIFPLIGLLFMVVIGIAVIRMASGQTGGHGGLASGEIEELRREVRELKEEIRKLRERS